MSSIVEKIHYDIEEYHDLCKYLGKKPKGQLDYAHFTKLKIKLQKKRDKQNGNHTKSTCKKGKKVSLSKSAKSKKSSKRA